MIDYGFGYDSVSDDYKCVRVLAYGDDVWRATNVVPCSEREVMVYSLKDDVWRTTPSTPHNDNQLHGHVYLNDIIHWVCSEVGDERLPLPIVTFDLRDESFSTLLLPNFATADLICMDVGILDGCLCLSVNYYSVYHVWAMKDYGVAWLYCLPSQNYFGGIRRPLCYSMNFNKLFVDIPFHKVVSVNLETMVMTDVKVADFDKCTDAHLCVENLLMLEGRKNTRRK